MLSIVLTALLITAWAIPPCLITTIEVSLKFGALMGAWRTMVTHVA